MLRWNVDIYWFDDDEYDTDVEADTIEDAARKVYEKWHPTGWTHALVSGEGRWLGIDLDAEPFSFTE